MYRTGIRALSTSARAKLNLLLAIGGRRRDGYHDLLSVVAQVELHDTLEIELRGAGGEGSGGFELHCEDPLVPNGPTNLVLRAADAFTAATGWGESASFRLTKRIPVGAGLGGGSSNAAAALRLLNSAAGSPLSFEQLSDVAATVGSDCPLFLHEQPVVVRGRGERIEPLPAGAASRVRGRRVLLFKPAFSVSTAWAYDRFDEIVRSAAPQARASCGCNSIPEAEKRLSDWLNGGEAGEDSLLSNNLEEPVFSKFVAIPVLLDRLRREHGALARMTGSGSACFAFLRDGCPLDETIATIRDAWGATAFTVVTHVS